VNQTGPNVQDPRSSAGILSRGQNIYQGAGYSPYVGKGPNFQQTANQQVGAIADPKQAMRPQNSMFNIDYSKVAQQWLQANMG
jgi:hypothetical protein